MTRRLRTWLATLVLLPATLVCPGCDDGSADPGAACVQSGGVCGASACGESLPYPCPGQETCCIPPQKTPPSPHDAGDG